MKLFAGNGCPVLATKVANKLGQRLSSLDLTRFSDGEIGVEVNTHVRGEDTFIIQSTGNPSNDNVMELATIADSLKRSDAHRVVAVIPYYGYSRQDRRPDFKRTPITSRLIADFLQVAGVNYVITVDIHSDQQQGFFNVPFVNVSAATVFVDLIGERHGTNFVTVSPDVGGVKRARRVAAAYGKEYDLAIIDKRRTGPNDSEVMNVIGDVEGRDCLLVDDMVDTAGTLCRGADALKARGARRVFAYVTHPVLSGPAIENILNSDIDKVVVTDTIPLNDEALDLTSVTPPRIEIVSVSSLLANAIKHISENRSISELHSNIL